MPAGVPSEAAAGASVAPPPHAHDATTAAAGRHDAGGGAPPAAAPAGPQPCEGLLHQPRASLTQLHDSVLLRLLAQLDARSKCALMCTCTQLAAHFGRREHWRELVFDTANEQHGLAPCVLFSLLRRSQGGCEVIQLARSCEARAAEGAARFSAGYKRDQVLPHTKGLRAYALAALCPGLRCLSLDERASCVGGMTDDLARALAVHCPGLSTLEVRFGRYSLPSELFRDEGLIALSEGCRRLAALTLHNCDGISDRSLYALAANCGQLGWFGLGGYNEHITDGGVTVLLEGCGRLHTVRFSSKLLKVTDASGASLARHCPSLTHVKLTQAMTDATLRQLAHRCPQLQEADLHRSDAVSCQALVELLQGCPRLHKLVLPHTLVLGPLLEALPGSVTVEEDEDEQEQQQRQTLRLWVR